MFNALKRMFLDDKTKNLLKAGFLEEDMSALTKAGVRAMWSILIPKYSDELDALAKEAIEEKKEQGNTNVT